jgi:glycosyltransferase involved in cell wall biosynthesis
MIAFIDDHRQAYRVEPICRVLPIAPSTYHAHAGKRADPSRLPERVRRDADLKVEIRGVFEENFRVYGVRKVWRQLRREGFSVARCTVARLMRNMGLRGAIRGKPLRTTVSDKAAPCPLDHVNRQFQAPAPDRLWLADFTYVSTWAGFTYVAFVIDAYGRSAMLALVRESLGGSRLVLSVDRLDCSKGIPERIKAFERFLEMNPDWHGKATLLQLTPKSWSDIKQYSEIESEVTGLIGKVNGRFGDAAWTPIRYVTRSYSRTVLAGIYRAAHVAMTTPLRDGMNLMAKEFLAAQDPVDPGVLMLSQFAGAAKELDEALIVNPHETDSVAGALKRALEMPLDERRERHAPMLAHLLKNDIDRWARSYTSTLRDGRTGRGLLGVLHALLKPSTAQTPRAALTSVEPREGDHLALS